ncbi:hypothetical protein Q4601_17885 [Shewanella sp. 1_MG-2023]|uniref:hypothetical protein n=1 Tax=unclassified Shewanella TaxID=196818 RepID=UPI0026E15128|nr:MULTISPECIES: hypothetical protein [unclassified Shewanella]MDO6613333.1 hypothetical protein [Shewanella sp. 7_MG-2023]MDO6773269.1 hypothetical protein [Shewanella sp. 2_MG-2023]MDO6796167.1 hypothetical protein [Shewanella sp. 1_MG-2023]
MEISGADLATYIGLIVGVVGLFLGGGFAYKRSSVKNTREQTQNVNHGNAYQSNGDMTVNVNQTESEADKELAEENRAKKSHDLDIITQILEPLPYEDSQVWFEQAGYAGLPRDFCHGLDSLEKFLSEPYKLYNSKVEKVKNELLTSIVSFNETCMGHLGAQENPKGNMYLPPYHWKNQGKESEARYYEQVKAVGNAGQATKECLDVFISVIKEESFIVNKLA